MKTEIARLVRTPPTIHREPESKVTMRAEHKTALHNIADEAARIALTATRIVQAVQELQSRGGALSIQPQVNFLTGAHIRLVKDWSIVEHLQAHGSVARRAPR